MQYYFVQYLIRLFTILLLLIVGVLFFRTFVIEPGIINGRSMEPAFFDDDVFFINKFSLLFTAPERGDIVQFFNEETGELSIKRIISLPGEKVIIKQNKVFIKDSAGNETELDEPYLAENTITTSASGEVEGFGPFPENEYFVLGDNREDSNDSRKIGPIHRTFITGRVF
ncbi:signal peptidase I [Patescibacteria group bacterium]